MQGGPLMHVIAAKAVAFQEAMQPEFVSYQQAVVANAKTLAAELSRNGLRLVSGGTENHLVLVDLSAAGLTGKQAEEALEAAGIAVNRNAIPFDTRPPQQASGIRLGTPAVTSRGFGTEEIKQVAGLILKVLNSVGDDKVASLVCQEVRAMCQRFPAPGISV
jgi:glycine hydroxymethyltransferase